MAVHRPEQRPCAFRFEIGQPGAERPDRASRGSRPKRNPDFPSLAFLIGLRPAEQHDQPVAGKGKVIKTETHQLTAPEPARKP